MFEKLLFEICLEIEIWGLKFLVLYTRTMRNYLRFLEAIPRQKVRSYVLLSRLPLPATFRFYSNCFLFFFLKSQKNYHGVSVFFLFFEHLFLIKMPHNK